MIGMIRRMGKGQVSVELLVVMGIVMILVLPSLFSVYFRINRANEQLSVNQADMAATRIANTISLVGAASGSSLISQVIMPSNVKNVRIADNEVVITLQTQNGVTSIVKSTPYNASVPQDSLKRMMRPGTYMLEIESNDAGVFGKLA
ncbi:MAG: hypothetical protein WC506_05120 [Candidatus Micrarchaeia archaeon]